MSKSVLNATETNGGHKILRIAPMGKQFSVIVEDKSWAAGTVTYSIGKSGRHANPNYSVKPV